MVNGDLRVLISWIREFIRWLSVKVWKIMFLSDIFVSAMICPWREFICFLDMMILWCCLKDHGALFSCLKLILWWNEIIEPTNPKWCIWPWLLGNLMIFILNFMMLLCRYFEAQDDISSWFTFISWWFSSLESKILYFAYDVISAMFTHVVCDSPFNGFDGLMMSLWSLWY